MTRATIQIGIVGLDTSHCPAFTEILNNAQHPHHVPGAQVIGAYPGGSASFSLSHSRVAGFTKELEDKWGIKIYNSIPDLAEDVDALLLESADGRQHLEQFRQLATGKPVYVDKPLATSVADAQEIINLARRTRTPIMSCSSLRYAVGIAHLLPEGERVLSCEAFGPAPLLPDYPGLFWYGIHSAEILFAFMGAGCGQVQCIARPDVDVIIGKWADERTGVMRGTRLEKGTFGCVVHTDTGVQCSIAQSQPPYYFFLLQKVVAFFQTGLSPVHIEETLNIIAFLEAADQSRNQNGQTVQISL